MQVGYTPKLQSKTFTKKRVKEFAVLILFTFQINRDLSVFRVTDFNIMCKKQNNACLNSIAIYQG